MADHKELIAELRAAIDVLPEDGMDTRDVLGLFNQAADALEEAVRVDLSELRDAFAGLDEHGPKSLSCTVSWMDEVIRKARALINSQKDR